MGTLLEALQDPTRVIYKDQNGRLVVGTDDAEAAASSGLTRVVVYTDADGRMVSGPVGREKEAQEQGLSPIDAQTIEGMVDKEKYGGVAGIQSAILAGASRGLTFGGSDWITKNIQGVVEGTAAATGLSEKFGDPERTFGEGFDIGVEEARKNLRGLEKENPVASIVGELAGAVLPAILSSGATVPESLAATAARGGPGAARALGAVLERGIIGQSKSTARKIVGKTLGGVAEAAPYGITRPVSAASLDEEAELTASGLIGDVAMSAVIGGGVGGAIGLAGATLPAVGKSLANSEWLKKVVDYSTKFPAIGKKFGKAYAWYAAKRSGIPRDKLDKMVAKIDDTITDDDLAEAMFRHINIEPGAQGAERVKAVRDVRQHISLLSDTNRANIIKNFARSLDDSIASDNKMMNKIIARVEEAKKTNPYDLGGAGDDLRELKKYVGTKNEFIKVFGRKGKVSEKKVEAFFNNVDERIDSEMSLVYKEFSAAEGNLADAAMKTAEELGEIPARKAMRSLLEQHNLFKFADKYAKTQLGIGDVIPIGIGLGASSTGVGGALLAASRLAKNPAWEISTLQHVLLGKNAVTNMIPKGVGGLFKKSGSFINDPAGRAVVNAAAIKTTDALFKGKKKAGLKRSVKTITKASRALLWREWQDEINMLANDPVMLSERVNRSTIGIRDILPRTAEAIHNKAQVAVQFLQSKAMDLQPLNDLSPLNIRTPEKKELRKFEKYYAYTFNPGLVFEEMSNGMVSPEGIETLMSVYPSLYKELVLQVMMKMHDPKTKTTWQARAKLSKILGIPEKDIIKSQKVYAQLAQPNQPDSQPASKQRERKMSNKALDRNVEAAQTDIQRLQYK